MRRNGYTLMETMFAVGIFALVIGMSLGTWLLFMYKSNRASTQASLDMDVRSVVERFRSEIRNTARETIIFYPEQKEPYEAVGFALAGDQDSDGLMDMDAGGSNILWRQTVVYHVWNHSPHQMRRTLFSNRNQEASYADRYNQIASVVTSGEGEGSCLSGESAKTMVLFSNLFTGRLWHAEAKFDGYAPVANTRDRVSFGSLALGPGAHAVNFTITGKNPNSTGRALRLDQVTASVAGWPMEAELCTAAGVATAPAFVGQGLASAAYGVKGAASTDGDRLSLTVYNDAIEECVFVGEGRNVTFSNTVVRLDATNAPSGFEDGVYVAKLDGQFELAWRSRRQAVGSLTPVSYENEFVTSDLRFVPGTNCAVRIPVLGQFVDRDGFGPIFRMHYSGFVTPNRFKVWDPAFAPTETTNSPSLSVPLTPLRIYQNGVLKAKWEDCTAGYVDLRPEKLVPVYAGQSFILSFWLTVDTPANDMIRAMQIPDASTWCCWMVKGGDAGTAAAQDWSGYSVEPLRAKDAFTGNVKLCVPGLVCMAVNYAEGGDYVSHVFDTKSEAGAAKTILWESDVPANATLKMYARGGNALTEDGFGISDASAWENVAEVSSGSTFSGNTGRYVQFRSVFTAQPASLYPAAGSGFGSAGPYRSNSPRLRRVLFTWDGEEKYVDVAAQLLKSPDCGIFRVDVDGRDLVQGVTMEIEIFKDVRTQGAAKERLRSAMTAEVEPRNSGK